MNESSAPGAPSGRTLAEILKEEPLVHFLGIAALLFVANALFSGDERETITVAADTQAFLFKQQEDLLLRPLTDDERQQIVDNFIEEEIFVREARERGFDSSSRIRTLLIQNMRFFLASDLPAASEAEYRRHYDENPDRFTTEERVSYDHVLFRDPESVPEITLAALREGADHRQVGDQDTLQSRLSGIDARNIAAVFGPDEAPRVLAIQDEDWHGPFLSADGAHFLRVIQRSPPRLPPFEDIRNWVETDWLAVESRGRVDEALARMREKYNVVIEPVAEPE